jgi:Uma2 family endonuclease
MSAAMDDLLLNAGAVRSSGLVHIVASTEQLPMRIRPAKRLADAELFELCRINRDLRIERTAEGELVIMSPTGGATGNRNFRLTVAFGIWVEKDGTGVGFDSSTGFVLPNGAERAPDVAWVKASRWDALTPEQREKFVPLCPDFVVEIRSRSDSLDELKAKLEEYVANGTALGWLIDPYLRQIHVYRPDAAPVLLDGPHEVSGEPVLAGFVLNARLLW